MAGGGQEEEEGHVEMNEKEEAEEEHEDDGDYEAGFSPAKRGVKRKGGGKRKVGRPKKVKVLPPPAVTPMSSYFRLYGGGRWTLDVPLSRIFSLLVLRVLVFCPSSVSYLDRFASQSYMYAHLLPAVSHSLVNVALFLAFG